MTKTGLAIFLLLGCGGNTETFVDRNSNKADSIDAGVDAAISPPDAAPIDAAIDAPLFPADAAIPDSAPDSEPIDVPLRPMGTCYGTFSEGPCGMLVDTAATVPADMVLQSDSTMAWFRIFRMTVDTRFDVFQFSPATTFILNAGSINYYVPPSGIYRRESIGLRAVFESGSLSMDLSEELVAEDTQHCVTERRIISCHLMGTY